MCRVPLQGPLHYSSSGVQVNVRQQEQPEPGRWSPCARPVPIHGVLRGHRAQEGEGGDWWLLGVRRGVRVCGMFAGGEQADDWDSTTSSNCSCLTFAEEPCERPKVASLARFQICACNT